MSLLVIASIQASVLKGKEITQADMHPDIHPGQIDTLAWVNPALTYLVMSQCGKPLKHVRGVAAQSS